ncbi:unnamed protein product [Spirodela intermedia]|uniref:Uncharacterized protein n=1 Tax=Spirodela intermedia TaxID=51605 RepID=A0A7I8K1C1_SPIIN|nr:unnamed protein product [Spirodela intermedia]
MESLSFWKKKKSRQVKGK